MRFYLPPTSLITITVLFLTIFSVVEAQTATTGEETLLLAPTEETPQIDTNREFPTQALPPEINREKPTLLSVVLQKRIINLAANISNRLEATTNRLDNIATRINSRSNKLKAAGVDTTKADEQLRQAQSTLSLARDDIRNIDTDIYMAITSETPREAWQTVKALYLSIHQNVTLTKASLLTTVETLKEAVAAPKINEPIGTASQTNPTTTEALELAE